MTFATSTRAPQPGLMAIFVADGAVFASWASRLPQVHADLHGGTGVLGLALAGTAVGALCAMPLTGMICRARSPYRVACIALFLLCCSLVLPGLATSAWTLGLALVVFGACYGATDVSMNAAAVELAAAVRRPIVPVFHAGYSLGALAGAGAGALAAGAGLGVPVHLAVVGAASVIALVITSGRLFVRPGVIRWPAVASRDPGPAGIGAPGAGAGHRRADDHHVRVR